MKITFKKVTIEENKLRKLTINELLDELIYLSELTRLTYYITSDIKTEISKIREEINRRDIKNFD